MIGTEDIEVMSKLGIGIDVDKLESYTLVIREALETGVIRASYNEYEQCSKILKNIKPDSVAIRSDITFPNGVINEYDDFIRNGIVNKARVAHGMKELEELREEIRLLEEINKEDSNIELLGREIIDGISIRIVYSFGNLVEASVMNKFIKGNNITESVRNLVPLRVDDWKFFRLVELRGTLEIEGHTGASQSEFKMALGDVLIKLKRKVRNIGANFICDDMLISANNDRGREIVETTLGRVSDRLDSLDGLGFKTVRRCIKENTGYYTFDYDVQHLINYIKGSDEHGLKISFNSAQIIEELGRNKEAEFRGVYNLFLMSSDDDTEYEAEVKNVTWRQQGEYKVPTLEIDEVILKNGELINVVELDSIESLIEYNIEIGKTVKLKVGNSKKLVPTK